MDENPNANPKELVVMSFVYSYCWSSYLSHMKGSIISFNQKIELWKEINTSISLIQLGLGLLEDKHENHYK